MGEAAAAPCLMRSVSQPLFASCGFKEGDRLRALKTSVSFGRFMTEPLDWERWSSFSHNRTLEDVQKYSRPGAVPEKKAFFEAYYKNFATKKGAKPPKTENKPPNFSETGDVDDTISSTCQVEQEKTSTENVSSNSGVKLDIASNRDVCLPSTNLVYSEIGVVDGVISSTGQVEEEKTSTENVSSPSTNLVSSNSEVGPETASNRDACLPSTNIVYSENGEVDGVISSTGQVEPSSVLVFSQFMDGTSNNRGVEPEISSKEDVVLPRTNLVFPENRNVDDMIMSSGEMEQEKTSTGNVSSVENLNHVEKNNKSQRKTKTEFSGVKSSSRKIPPIDEIQHKKAAAMEKKKKSVLQSLHSSTKFPASLNKSFN